MAVNSNKKRDIVISVMGGAGLYPMGMGEALNTYHFIRDRYPNRQIYFSGVSSGSWVALMLALDVKQEQIKPYFDYFKSLFDKWYKTRYFYWFKNLEKLTRKIIRENGGYEKVSNKLFVGMTSFDHSNKRFVFKNETNFQSEDEIIHAIMASSHLFVIGLSWIRYYRGNIAFDGNFMKPNVILDNGKYINILIKYRLRFDNKYIYDSMISYCPNKWNRLYCEGVKKYENNKSNYIQQIEMNQILPDSYYTDGYLPDLKLLLPKYRKKRKISLFFFILMMVYYTFKNRRKYINQCLIFLSQLLV
eukprot:203299_1